MFRGFCFRAKKILFELNKACFFPLSFKEKSQMAQSPKLPFPSSLPDMDGELPKEPRLLFIRVSLDLAQIQGRELRRLATSSVQADSHRAIGILQSEALAAPEKEHIQKCWGHPNASYWLLHTSADSDAFSYSHEDLYIASTFCAAELQVSRDASMRDLELRIFGLVAAANKLITGWWKGRQLGLARFLASAARRNGAIFSPNGVSHRAWGLGPNSELEEIV